MKSMYMSGDIHKYIYGITSKVKVSEYYYREHAPMIFTVHKSQSSLYTKQLLYVV